MPGHESDPTRDLLLPAVWRRTAAGLAAISANGYGSIVPNFLRHTKDTDRTVSSLGRRYFLEELIGLAAADAELHHEFADRATDLRRTATNLDQLGE